MLYVKWAAETALSLNTTVPWVMCVQEDAPDPIVSVCTITGTIPLFKLDTNNRFIQMFFHFYVYVLMYNRK